MVYIVIFLVLGCMFILGSISKEEDDIKRERDAAEKNRAKEAAENEERLQAYRIQFAEDQRISERAKAYQARYAKRRQRGLVA